MAVNPYESRIRLGGLSSGLDTDAMVKSLMRLEQMKVDRVWQQKTRLEWKKEARIALEQKITAFRNATMSVLSPDTNLFASNAFNTFKTTLDTAATSVSLIATEQAAAGRHTIDSITQLASAASAASAEPIGDPALNRNSPLASLPLAVPLSFGGVGQDEIAFRINDVTLTFKSTTTLQQMINQVNASAANAIMSYSELTGRLTLASRTTGSDSQLSLENVTGNAFGSGSAFALETGTCQNGADALLSVDGVAVRRSSNAFILDGISYQLSHATQSPVSFTVDRQIEPTVERIRNFVMRYNQLLDEIQNKLDEEVHRDFQPLTFEQRNEMSEQEAAQWDAKARSGLLRQDRQTVALVGQLRRMFFDPAAGTGKSLANIGLTTGSYQDRGRIQLDETTLRTALSRNPDEVMQLFTQASGEKDVQTRYNASGLIPRMQTAFGSYTASFDPGRANHEIGTLSLRLNSLTGSLGKKEETYWKRFSAMEKALYDMQAQSSWLTSQLG